MSELYPYDVVVNGVATTLLLSAADAAERGLPAPATGPPAVPARAQKKTAARPPAEG